MRVIVTGGRRLDDYDLVDRALTWVHEHFGGFTLVHGDAEGADELAGHWAGRRALPVEPHPADWARYASPGRKNPAGPIRNQGMVDAGANLLVRFPGGAGTHDCATRAERAGIPVLLAYRRDGRVYVQQAGAPEEAA